VQSRSVIVERCLKQQRFRLSSERNIGLSSSGRAFQARAAATGNARSPSVVRRVVGTSSVDDDPGGGDDVI